MTTIQNPMLTPGFKLGTFSSNADGGLSLTKVPERWNAGWDDVARAAQLADEGGMDFILPIARWKGFGGTTHAREHSFETFTFAAGLVLTLTDAGDTDEALRVGREWVARVPDDVELRLALAYACARSGLAFEALYHTDRARQLAPQAAWVQREVVFALARAGVLEPALQRAREQSGLFSPAEMRALQADVAALKTRLAVLPTRSESERFVLADRALAMYDAMLVDWPAQGAEAAAAADLVRIRIDRLSALHARARMSEVVREYEALIAEGVAIPAWARANVASAYLSVREPEHARDLYRAVLVELDAATPPATRHHLGPAAQRLEYDIGLFYALVEAEQFDEIEPVLARIRAYRPAWLYARGNPRPLANPLYLDAQLAAGVTARLMVDDTVGAQARLEAMLRTAPNNTHLRTELAGIYRARGWPRQAEKQLKLAETMTPRARDVIIGQGEAALDVQAWRQAQELSADVLARFPENPAVQRLARRWTVHNLRELRVSASKGLASDAPHSGSGELALDTVVYSAPIAYNWRGFAGAGLMQGQYAEGRGRAHWQRGGVEWRSRGWWAEGEVSMLHANGRKNGGQFGLALAAAHDIDDYWQLGASLERHSRGTPLRALRSGIGSHTQHAWLRWRGSERQSWRFDVSAAQFSDGNHRQTVSISGQQRLLTGPRATLDALFDAATQRSNKDAERPYFNPKRDLTLLPALRVNHVLHRRYETVWTQHATVATGTYRQRGFGTGGVVTLAYGQRIRTMDKTGKVLDAGVTVRGASRPYDGRREREWSVLIDVGLRF